jgi:hypothetical protein
MGHAMMSFLKNFCGIALVFVALGPLVAQAYYGRHSTEAILTYDAWLDVPDELKKREVEESIDEQIQYLVGDFQSESFREKNGYYGMTGEDYDFQITGEGPSPTYGNKRFFYRYKGKVIFAKKIFRGGKATRSVPIRLPLDLDVYYRSTKRDKNHCTDPVFNGYEDFWYFWDPDKEKCPLKDNSQDVIRIEGTLKLLENTKNTYPEYDRLFADNGNGSDFEVSIFLGYITQYNIEKPSPRDEGAINYQALSDELSDLGFEIIDEKNGFRLLSNGREAQGANLYRVFEKEISTPLGKKLARIKVLLADTSYEARDGTFHAYFVPALENSDIMIYDGHSELGAALGFEHLPPVRFNKKKYQIFFFNGCNSYPYYNAEYISRKGGSQNLEVITAGLPTLVSSGVSNTMSFLNGFVSGKTISYQTLISRLEASNEDMTYLFGVSGDEDNQFLP